MQVKCGQILIKTYFPFICRNKVRMMLNQKYLRIAGTIAQITAPKTILFTRAFNDQFVEAFVAN